MKRKFTFLIAAIAAILMMAQPVKVVGQTKTTKTYKLTIDKSSFNTSGYDSNNNEKTSYAVNISDNTDTYQVKWTSYQVMRGTGGNTNYMQWQKSKGYIYNSTNLGTITGVTVTSSAGTFTTKYGSSENTGCSSSTVGGGFFKTSVGSATGYTSKIEVTFTVTTYTVTYDGNEATSGTAPTDSNSPYLSGSNVTVLGNTGSLVKDGYNFSGWCLNAAGTGTVYGPGDGQTHTLESLSDNTVFYAKWTAAGNYINISPTTANVTTSAQDFEFDVATDQPLTASSVQFYTAASGGTETSKPDWIGTIAYDASSSPKTLTVPVAENTGVARHAYFTLKNGTVESSRITINQAAITVLPPTFNHGTGTYYENQSITLTNQTAGASIYYTIGPDPADPTSSSTPYTAAISVTESTKIKAIAIKNGVSSTVATASYTIIHPITIDDARKAGNGQSVTTRGIVTYISGKYAYIQDASEAALCLYKSSNNWNNSTTELTVGDDIVASGPLSIYENGGDLLEISNPTRVKLSSGNEKPCVTKTIAQINSDNFNAFQGLFVQIVKATYNSDDNEVSQGSDVVSVSGTMGEAEDEDVVTFKGNITYSSEIIIRNLQDVTVIKDPAIISNESLSVPNYVLNTPEESVDYDILTVNGTNLKGNITVTLEKEGSSDFELLVSENPDTWGYTMQLTPTTGTVSDALIAVRLKAGKTVADYSDRIVLSSTDATTVYVTVSGSVTYANVTYSGNAEGVTNVPEDTKDYVYNEEVTVLGKGTMARTGYNFGWWDTQADGKGTPYDPEDEDNNKFNITANTTLYAIWEVQTYNYELNVTGDDDDAVAELEVDGNPVAANAKIAYGKEVTVNVVVTDGYIYSISVNNGAVTVTNDKFTMPAGDVTVTVTTEANPYIKAKLLSADILNMTTDTQNDYGYGTIKTKEITSNDTLYVWQTNGYQHTNNNVVDLGMIQLRVRTNVTKGVGYIKLPDFAGKIENIKFDVSGNGNSDTSPTSSKTSTKLYFQEAPTSDGTIIAEGGGSATNTITISLADKCYSTGYIVANGGLRVWNIVVTYRPYQNMTGTELTTIASDQTISIPASTNATATNLTIPASSGIIIKSGASLTVSGTLSVGEGGTANNIVIEDGGKLVTHNAVQATVKKNVTAAAIWGTTGDSYTPDGWYFIASPVNNASFSTAITSGDDNDYDLFMLDWTNNKWRNKKDTDNNTLFAGGFQRGTGYLYASQAGNTLSVAGAIQALSNDDKATVELANDGWNLIGNPLTCKVTVDCAFGSLNNGSTVDYTANTVNPFQGIAVYGNAGTTVTFTKATTQNAADPSNNISLQMTLAKKVTSRGETSSKVVDNAVVSFSESKGLPKFNMLGGNVKLYIPQNDEEYAVAFSNKHGDVPLNFKAKELGTYTISFEGEEMDLNGIYLIDMLDEVEIDLGVNPSYTFIGSPVDRSARFKIVFRNVNGDSTSDIFAYQSGSDIVVSGEGELQIFDVMGRMVARQNVNGVQTINAMAHGVYIFKLNEKTQKIIVK